MSVTGAHFVYIEVIVNCWRGLGLIWGFYLMPFVRTLTIIDMQFPGRGKLANPFVTIMSAKRAYVADSTKN